MTLSPLAHAVAAAMRDVAAAEILPRFRNLASADISQKEPGQIVTVADIAAERALTPRLIDLLPGSQVVGEEASADDPGLAARLLGVDGDVWVIDPIDGTSNFARGHADFVVMVALVRDRVGAGAWILDAVHDGIAIAEAGGGAWWFDSAAADGQAMRVAPARPLAELRGTLPGKLFPKDWRKELDARGKLIAEPTNRFSAGHEYLDIAAGRSDFALYWNTKSWDHAAGDLLVREAGGRCARLDGSSYRAVDLGPGLIVASGPAVWDTVRGDLLGGLV